MKGRDQKPQVVREGEVKMVGPGHDESHYITVPIKPFYAIEDVGHIGVCHMEPGQESCAFALEEEDDGTTLHYYGPADEFYYILEGEFTLWWGKDAADLDNHFLLKKGDCTYFPTGYKYKVKNTGSVPGKFFYFMTTPEGVETRLDIPS
jgi:mannose-6-phosphate isomerase-like protein (cupin superfamily)